jgi:predicted aminopeptidase
MIGITPTSITRLVAIALAPLMLSGCYLMQAAQGQLSISSNRKPIAEVIAAPETSAQLRERLKLIADAREFASHELGLPDNQSYRSFVDLKRDYAVWNVFATDRFSVEPRRWCFPIAGCVVYRGYFKESAAQDYALNARAKGGDAAVSGAAAYSTLGHFNDPVLSSMLRWSDTQIGATLFHELAHQVYYVPNESEFNEAFASVVEEAGAKRWLEKRGDSTSFAAWEIARLRGNAFTDLLLATRERLRALYATEPPSLGLYIRKQQEFGRLKFDYWQLKASWNGYSGYDDWFNRTLGNADLIAAATYESCVPGLENLLAKVGGDLPKFYEAVKQLDKEARHTLCKRLGSEKVR